MQKRYKILAQEGADFAYPQRTMEQIAAGQEAQVGDETEIELTVEQERAMIAAGWIEGPIESKKKGG